MAAETLQSDLLAVPGVASAEVDLTDAAAPAGVKVRLAPDADARRVGVEVQRVLAAHGMRSRFSSTGSTEEAAGPPSPLLEPPPGTPGPAATGSTPPPPPTTVPPSPVTVLPGPPSVAPPIRVSVPEVESVSVEERSDGLTAVVVMANGHQASQVVGTDPNELDAAVVAAVAEAAGQSVTRVALEWLEIEGGSVVTVVVKRADGVLAAGAGVVRVGRAFAVGIATRSALDA